MKIRNVAIWQPTEIGLSRSTKITKWK